MRVGVAAAIVAASGFENQDCSRTGMDNEQGLQTGILPEQTRNLDCSRTQVDIKPVGNDLYTIVNDFPGKSMDC